jgi:4-amino-4-deoxy-L-arabinose transferase-like glycosyltransferase
MPDRPKKPSSPEQRVQKFERYVVEEIEMVDTASARKAVKRERFTEWRYIAVWLGLWMLLVAASLFVRQLWPNDETRVLGIAWEMWARGKWVVPYLNGEPEVHAPFFFWLIQLGWSVFGVTEWWARLVAPLGMLASLFVVQRIARLLWPEEREVARYVPLILLGTLAFALAVGPALPDTWSLCFILVTLWAWLIQWRRRDWRSWILAAVALGLAMLSAGFIVLIYVLPLALLAPIWARSPRPQWKYWYVDVFKAAGVAGVIFGVWVAAIASVESGPEAIRLLSHAWKGLPLDLYIRQHPWWWYLWMVPWVFLPWSVLPLAWMHLWHIRREPLDNGFTFCLLWIVLPLALLSVFPIKQAHYLLPLLPAGALMTSRLLFAESLRTVHEDKGFAGMAIPLIVFGGVLMVLPRLPRVDFLPALLWQQSPMWGMAIMAVGIAAGWLPLKDVRKRVLDLVTINVLLVTFVLLGVARYFNPIYPLADVGRVLTQSQAQKQPIAYVGDYRGEFHFTGRLSAPVSSVESERVEAWMAANPTGIVVTRANAWQPPADSAAKPILDLPFRDSRVHVIAAKDLAPR